MPDRIDNDDYPGKGNPWFDFLHYRARALHYFKEEGKSFPEITDIMNFQGSVHAQMVYVATGGELP